MPGKQTIQESEMEGQPAPGDALGISIRRDPQPAPGDALGISIRRDPQPAPGDALGISIRRDSWITVYEALFSYSTSVMFNV